jgi:catechol 2,3-dioxygenase-like lactoylglutathione lyase family enzyme
MDDAGRDHRVTHVGICVADLDASLAFYERALGFVSVGRMQASGPETATILSVPGCAIDLAYLERDGLRIELIGYEAGVTSAPVPRPMDQLGFTHLSIRVSAFDDLLSRIEDHGGSVIGSTRVTFEWGNRGVMALDPDGTRIELIEKRPT